MKFNIAMTGVSLPCSRARLLLLTLVAVLCGVSFATTPVLAADPSYTVVAVPLALPARVAMNNKSQVASTRVESNGVTLRLWLPTADYGLPPGVHAFRVPLNLPGTSATTDLHIEGFADNGSVYLVEQSRAYLKFQNGAFTALFGFEPNRSDLFGGINLSSDGSIFARPWQSQPGQTGSYRYLRVRPDGSRDVFDGPLNRYIRTQTATEIYQETEQFGLSSGNSNGIQIASSIIDIQQAIDGQNTRFQKIYRTGLWNGAFNEVPLPSADPYYFVGINDKGQMVSQGVSVSSSNVHCYLPSPDYGRGSGTVLVSYRPVRSNVPLGLISDHGEIYGVSYHPTAISVEFFSLKLNKTINLNNSLVTNSAANVVNIRGINQKGVILAEGTLNGQANKLMLCQPGGPEPRNIVVNSLVDLPQDPSVTCCCDTGRKLADGVTRECSLRAAIEFANSTHRPGEDTIQFNIDSTGPVVITPTRPLPEITEPLTIDGTTQPSAGRVGINGASAGSTDGLRLSTSNCYIRGLSIQQFQRAGIRLEGGHSHTLQGNLLGTDVANPSARASLAGIGIGGLGNYIGLFINDSHGNLIGGFNAIDRNVVSANLTVGILITNCSDIDVRANLVGTSPDGTEGMANGSTGLLVENARRLTVGTPGLASVLNSANAAVFRNVNDAEVNHCFVGLNASGDAALGDTVNGLQIEHSTDVSVGKAARNILGGISSIALNVLNSTNVQLPANYIGTDRNGLQNIPVASGIVAASSRNITIGSKESPSVVCATNGMLLRGMVGLLTNLSSVSNCRFGVGADGTNTLGTMANGLVVENSQGLVVGGTARNIFGGIESIAIKVLDSKDIQMPGNFIGTDQSGNTSLPVGTGILAERSQGITIGSSNSLSVISAGEGLIFRNLSNEFGKLNALFNCHIGIGSNGTSRLAPMMSGLMTDRSSGVIVGGSSRNLFGTFSTVAIAIFGSSDIQLAGNYIGTDRTGNTGLPVGTGILAEDSQGIVVGSSNTLSVINATNAIIFRNLNRQFGGMSALLNSHVGVGANGTTPLGTMANGLISENSDGLIVGGPFRNVFGGISSNAIALFETTNVQLAANFIGTDRSGKASIPVSLGIFADRVQNIAIGLSNALTLVCATNGALFTQLAGVSNTVNNCFFGINSNGLAKLGNMVNGITVRQSSGLRFGDTLRNVFSGISGTGISLQEVTNVSLEANFIGTDRTGSASVPVGLGVLAEKVKNIAIGTSNALSLITATNGVILRRVSGPSNTVDNCYFGLAANGTTKVGNMRNGFHADDSSDLALGRQARNAFANIASNAITFLRATNIHLQDTLIGTDATGLTRAPVGGSGILAVNTRGLTVGDDSTTPAAAGARVQIAGCAKHGVESLDSELRLVNTLIGTDTTGTKALANSLSGVRVHLSSEFEKASPLSATSMARNTIAFNGGSGVEITQDPGLTVVGHEIAHVMQGNRVMANTRDGIRVGTNVSSILIGDTNLAGANIITRNGGSGISKRGVGERFFVEINTILSNSVKAIERVADPQGQAAPLITSAVKGSTHVQGNVSGQPNATVRLHFYAHRPRIGAQGEGEMWVGSINVPLNAAGAGSYDSVLPRTTPAGWLVASTATDSVRGTSEFSASRAVQLAPDADGDGMPDAWEALYPSCLNPAVPDGDGDCDHDGFTNLQEYIAHTDPTRADSGLRVESLVATTEGGVLKFTGVAGRQYALERRIDLIAGSWVRVATSIPEADGEVTLRDPDGTMINAYYRVMAEFP